MPPEYLTPQEEYRLFKQRRRFGTARRDGRGRLMQGEYNGRGLPMGTRAAGADRGLSPAHDWYAFEQAFHPEKAAAAVADDSDEEPGAKSYVEQFGPSQTGEPLRPVPAQSPQLANSSTSSRGGGVTTRRTLDGRLETQDTKTGRWVASISNPPAPGRTSDRAAVASAASPTGPTVRNGQFVNPVAKLDPNIGKSGLDAALARNLDVASNPSSYFTDGQRPAASTPSSGWWDAGVNSPGIQALLDDGARSNPDRIASRRAADAIAANGGREGSGMTPYGSVAVTTPQGNAARLAASKATITPPATTGAAGPTGEAGTSAPPATVANSDEWFGPAANNAQGRTLDDVAKDKAAKDAGTQMLREKEQAKQAANVATEQKAREEYRDQLRKGQTPADPDLQVPDYAWGWQ